MKYCLLLCSIFLFLTTQAQEDTTGLDSTKITKTGLATYYHRKFEGRKTSSGVRYRKNLFTAAHRTLPFGTQVTVTNLSNGKSVTVEINDRGPFTRRYIIDVSEGAARELGLFGKGHSQVQLSYEPKI